MQSELHGPPENKPMEVAQPIKTWCLVEDSSLHMELTVQDPEGGNLRELPVVILPHAIAWELHNHLGQYLIRQQVYDQEFREPPGSLGPGESHGNA
jgi:hypothetical protein